MRVRWLLPLAILLPLFVVPAVADDPPPGTLDPKLEARIKALIEQLGAPSWALREKASKALVQIGEPAITLLRRASDSDDLERRWRARKILIKLGALVDPKFLKQVRELLAITVDERRTLHQRQQAQAQLVGFGEKVLPAFFRILVEKDYRMRRHVTELAAQFRRHRQVVPLLLKALEDKDAYVRSGAARVLRQVSGKTFASYETGKWQAWWAKARKTWKPPRDGQDPPK